MNRREFVKALVGVPLLGLLMKLPERKEPYREIDCLTFNGASRRVDLTWANRSIGDDEPEDWLVERYKDENGDWHERVLVGSPPADLHWDEESLPGTSFWNGQKWIPAELQQRMCFY